MTVKQLITTLLDAPQSASVCFKFCDHVDMEITEVRSDSADPVVRLVVDAYSDDKCSCDVDDDVDDGCINCDRPLNRDGLCDDCNADTPRRTSEFLTRMLAVMDEMEGLYGPDREEYITIMADVANEATTRIHNAIEWSAGGCAETD